jgi:hypothetical protein
MEARWVQLDDETAASSNAGYGHMGVFELADKNALPLLIGYAGGRSVGGLSREIREAYRRVPEAALVRWEITTSYLSRYQERLMRHVASYGKPPIHNPDAPKGQLSP